MGLRVVGLALVVALLSACGGHAGAGAGLDYRVDSSGQVVEIGDLFFEQKKVVRILDEQGRPVPAMWFEIERGRIHIKSLAGSGAEGPIEEHNFGGERCRGEIGRASTHMSEYYICVSDEPVPSGLDGKNGMIPANTPYVFLTSTSIRGNSVARARFSVIDGGLAAAPTSAQSGEDVARLAIDTAAAPTKCELIAEGERIAQARCNSGELVACREIAGWVANKVYEGCTVSDSHSPASGSSSAAQHSGGTSQAAQESDSPIPYPTNEDAPEDVAEEVVEMPIPQSTPEPKYPPAAFRAGIQGTVVVKIHVSANGNVTAVEVVESSGNRDLDHAATKAAWMWKYIPGKGASGRNVPAKIKVPITFGLS